MTKQAILQSTANISVALVDGEPSVRRARQIMLGSEDFNVRSYATCAAILADPLSRDFSSIVVDIEMQEIDGIGLLREMRATGWRGKGILLDGIEPGSELMREAEQCGDKVMPRSVGDATLVAAIAALVNTPGSPGPDFV